MEGITLGCKFTFIYKVYKYIRRFDYRNIQIYAILMFKHTQKSMGMHFNETVISVFPIQAFMLNLLSKDCKYIMQCLLHHLV